MNSPKRKSRKCRVCRKPERTRDLGGVVYSDIAEHSGICARCINRLARKMPKAF